MPLPWVRLDGNISTHDKILELVAHGQAGKAAGFVYVCSLAYCGNHGTDGLISFAALPFVHGTKREAAMLVDVVLWVPQPTGWAVRNWAERQQSAATTAEVSAKRRLGAKKANCVRWHGIDCACWLRDSTPPPGRPPRPRNG